MATLSRWPKIVDAGFVRRSLPAFLLALAALIGGQLAYDGRERQLDERAAAQIQSTLKRQAATLLDETQLGLETLAAHPDVLNAKNPAVRRTFASVFKMLSPLGIATLSQVRIQGRGKGLKAFLTIMAPEPVAPQNISDWEYLPGFQKHPRVMSSRMFDAIHDHVKNAIVIWVPAEGGAVSALLNVDRFASWLASTQPNIAGRLSFVVDGKPLPMFGGDPGPEALSSTVQLGASTWTILVSRPRAMPWPRVLALQLLLAALIGALSAWARTVARQRRVAHENLELLVTRMRSAVLTTDTEGRIYYSNPFSDALFAGEGQSLSGRNIFDSIVPERDREGARTQLSVKGLLEKMKDTTGEESVNENVTLGGKSMWMAWTNSKLRDADGRSLIVSVGNDITAQKEMERLLAKEKRRSDQLLRAILPDEKVEELKRTDAVAPMMYENVAVFFTDVVDFTRFSDAHCAEEVVRCLQEMVAAFERICALHRIEKIKTIGDAFMGVGGLLSTLENPALSATRCALDLVAATKNFQSGWKIRAGVHIGPVQAGVIGTSKFLFDVFGDTVNTASRMESNGLPGAVTVSAAVWAKIAPFCVGRKRGDVELKGKGTMEMYVVEGLKP